MTNKEANGALPSTLYHVLCKNPDHLDLAAERKEIWALLKHIDGVGIHSSSTVSHTTLNVTIRDEAAADCVRAILHKGWVFEKHQPGGSLPAINENHGCATTDMGMRASFLRGMQALLETEQLADDAIAFAKADPVHPINGHPASRYMVKTANHHTTEQQASAVVALLEENGLRLHRTKVPSLTVVFFDASDPLTLSALTLPDGWAVERLSHPLP
jgi:hypothetical protein